MKKIMVSLLILGLLSSGAIVQAAVERGYISINTNANTEIFPDVAEVSFAIQTSDTKSMQNATKSNKEISDRVYNELKNLINTQEGDYIKTSNFSASPIYTYTNSKKTFEKYQVTNRVSVHTKSIQNIGKMLDKALQAGATNVDSLIFSVSNYDKQCDELILEASNKAYKRASIIAKATNSNLDGIRTFETSCSTNNNQTPRLYMAKNMLSAVADEAQAAGSTIPIADGIVKIYANVNTTFFVK